MITSSSNPKVKQARALRNRKQRQATGLFLLEGIFPVGEAVASGVEIVSLFYAPELLNSEFAWELVREQTRRGVECFPIGKEVFFGLAEKENPQGILAVAKQSKKQLSELNPGNFAWGVALVAPQDPGNVGTILRTINAVGASGLLLLDNSVDAFHPTSVRASMGALFWQSVVYASFNDFSQWAHTNVYHIYGSSAHATQDYRQIEEYKLPLILLLGSEREGLTPAQREVCQATMRIPMHGRVTSLNLAVAAGVMLYDMVDKIKGK